MHTHDRRAIISLLSLPGAPSLARTCLVHVDIDLDFRGLDVLALLDAGVCVRGGYEGFAGQLVLELFVVAALAEFVDTGVVDLSL